MEFYRSGSAPAQSSSFVSSTSPYASKPSGRNSILDFLSTAFVIAAALTLAFGLIAFVFQSYQVDGPSMQNTLHNNDRLIVWKAARTWSNLIHHPYIPNRGDIIIFNESGLAQYGQDNTKQLVKRVIGLPGDRVVVQNGLVTIYNKQHVTGFNPDKTLAYGKANPIPYTSQSVDITLGSNQLFVCGDNRPDSLDSRIFGPIDASQIVGKLIIRIYPLSAIELF